MVFVTVGSHPTYRFDRLVQALPQVSSGLDGDEEMVVQYGPAEAPTGVAQARQWLTFEEILEHMKRARVVISHAGAGTLLCAHQIGHIPIVVPRLERYGETVDDHQVDLAKAFEQTSRVLVAWEMDQLSSLLTRVPDRGEAPPPADNDAFHSEVRSALLGESCQKSL